MKIIKIILSIWVVAYIGLLGTAAAAFKDIGECMVANDIGIYKYKQERANLGDGSGVVGLADHFDSDHVDVICTGRYSNINQLRGLPHTEIRQKLISVKVEVTQHSSSDSDRWLLHEVDIDYRNYYGIPGKSYAVLKIDGNTIMEFGSGGWDYRWISGTKVIQIGYTDLDMVKPEPLEIIKAYLAKHPSTLPAMTLAQLRSSEHKTAWIRDEMDRRLWLCDKWFLQLQLGKAVEKDVYREAVKSMTVFLDYREKYFGINGDDEGALLDNYLDTSNGAGIKAKLDEYQRWWSGHRSDAITLP